MLAPGVVKDYNSEFNSISRDLVSYVQRQKSGPNGDRVLQDLATSFFKLTHECKRSVYNMPVCMYYIHRYLIVSNLNHDIKISLVYIYIYIYVHSTYMTRSLHAD